MNRYLLHAGVAEFYFHEPQTELSTKSRDGAMIGWNKLLSFSFAMKYSSKLKPYFCFNTELHQRLKGVSVPK